MPTIMKMINATTLPIEATADKSNNIVRTQTTMVDSAVPRLPFLPACRPKIGGIWPIFAR